MSSLRTREQRVRVLAAAVLLGLAGGCDADAVGPRGGAEVAVAGRLERSLVIELHMVVDGDTVPPGEVEWTASPSGAVDFSEPGRARLIEAGSQTLTARSRGATASAELRVAVPPSILFDMIVDGNRDVYRVSLDGRDLERITTSPAADMDASRGPESLVFTSYRDGNAELYRIAGNGLPERLTSTPEHETSPRLSPAGDRMVFLREGATLPRLWIGGANAGDATRAAPAFGYPGAVEASPSWSPDGSGIVFVSTQAGSADLYVLAPASGTVEALVATAAPEVEPAWSPDGARVAFTSARAGDTDLYLVSLVDGAVTRLTDRPGTDGEPAWLPDGRIVYVAWEASASALRWLDPDQPAEVHSIPLEGVQPRNPAGI